MAEQHKHRESQDAIWEPEPAHVRRQSQTPTDEDDGLEATELRDVPGRRISRVITKERPQLHWYDPLKKVWRHNIRISVPHVDCRDHLANERTFLGYLRTSLALSMLGVVVSQLYRLQHAPSPDAVFGYFVLSKPLACILQTSALIMALVGCHRFFRQQSAMAVGKVHAGGWELSLSGGFVVLLLFGLFVVHIAVDAYKDR